MDGTTVLAIEEIFLPEDTYVYDLETEDGTFSVCNNIIIHNTDSVFIHKKNYRDINLENNEEVDKELVLFFEKGKDIANDLNKLFLKPISIEFEKVYLPFLIYKKKNYIGRMFTVPENSKGSIDKKGIVLKRRDNPNITKKVYQGIIDLLFLYGKVKGLNLSVQFIKDEVEKIVKGEVDINDLIVTKTYKRDYKSQNIPHKVLAEKMYERDPGSAPNINDRVPYVFIDKKVKNQYEKVEHPDYVLEHGLKLDHNYYVKQLVNPVTQILELFMSNEKIERIFKEAMGFTVDKNVQIKLTKYFKKK